MKKITLMIAVAAIGSTLWTACNRAQAYTDLYSGHTVYLVEDEETGMMVDRDTREPVYLYVNNRTKDTVFGPTGEIVNNRLTRTDYEDRGEKGGKRYYYVYENGLDNKDYAVKVKSDDGEYKYERERDGDYKMKQGDDYKVKYHNGEYKVKRGDYKYERERDGDVTIKDGDKKIKIDGETGERKVKYD